MFGCYIKSLNGSLILRICPNFRYLYQIIHIYPIQIRYRITYWNLLSDKLLFGSCDFEILSYLCNLQSLCLLIYYTKSALNKNCIRRIFGVHQSRLQLKFFVSFILAQWNVLNVTVLTTNNFCCEILVHTECSGLNTSQLKVRK